MIRRILICAVLAATLLSAADTPRRIVSLIPAVTEMIFVMGEGARIVGVSSYDRYPPQVSSIARVGGLLDPSVERLLRLKPDLVIVYDTQRELKLRLERAEIPSYLYEHRDLSDITRTLRAVGARIGASDAANRIASKMESDLDALRRSVATLPRVKVLLVFGRDAGSLRHIDASGGYGFLHDMVEAAGGDDVFGDIKQQSVQTTAEMILARRPEVIIELRYGDSAKSLDVKRELSAWDALPSVPAVKNHKVHILVGDEFVVPGPRVVDATRTLATVLHPER